LGVLQPTLRSTRGRPSCACWGGPTRRRRRRRRRRCVPDVLHAVAFMHAVCVLCITGRGCLLRMLPALPCETWCTHTPHVLPGGCLYTLVRSLFPVRYALRTQCCICMCHVCLASYREGRLYTPSTTCEIRCTHTVCDLQGGACVSVKKAAKAEVKKANDDKNAGGRASVSSLSGTHCKRTGYLTGRGVCASWQR
jgi:hypothetical protein